MEQGEETSQGAAINVSELQTQFDFEQQQSQIAQLRDTLQRNQQTLSSTEKDKENYVATLSRIRMQRRGKGSQKKREEVVEPDIATPSKADTSASDLGVRPLDVSFTPDVLRLTDKPITPGSAGRVRVNLLTQEVEEKRQLMEKVKRMNQETKQSIAGMAEQLRLNLPEQETASDFVETEVTPGKAPVINPSSDTSREMYAQILYKDNKIIELNNRILELERNIMDYQENLREKDAVLDAKARSITLITEDLSRKNKVTVDALEETRQQMREMQSQFVEMESKLKSENKTLSTNLATKDQRLSQLESLRFEMSTRNAELQQKVVILQTRSHEILAQGLPADKEKIEELTKQLSELTANGLPEDKTQISEMTKQLEESTKLVAKTKNQYGKRIKNLEKQLAALKKSDDVEQELQRLQNRIAELEEEKGNLQLNLVDFDEMKITENQLTTRVAELESLIELQTQELNTSKQSLSSIKADKIQLTEDVKQLQASESELQAELEAAQAALQERDNAKVEAEMKTVELEERLDQLNSTHSELEAELASLRQVIQSEEKTLTTSLVASQAAIELSHSEVESLSQQLDLEKTSKSELETSLQLTKDQLSETENQLQILKQSNKTHEHSNLSLQKDISNLQQELQDSQDKNQELSSQISKLEEELRTKLDSTLEELNMHKKMEENIRTESENLLKQLQVKEEELTSLRVTVEMQGALGEEVEKWRSKLQKQRDEVQSLTQQLETSHSELEKLRIESENTKELKVKVRELSDNVISLQATNTEQAEMIQHTQQAVSAKETEHEAEVEALEVEVQKKQQRACDLEEQLSKVLDSTQDVQSQLEIATQELEEIKKLRNESDIMIERLSLQINQMEEEYRSVCIEKQNLSEEIEQLKKEKTEVMHTLSVAQNSIKELQHEMDMKNKTLQNIGEAEQNLVAVQTELTHLQRKYHDETLTLKQRVEQAEDEVTAAFSQVDHMTKEHKIAQDNWQQEQEILNSQLSELGALRENFEDNIYNLENNVTSLQVQLGVVIGEKEAVESQLTSLNEKLQDISLLQKQNEIYIQQISELQMELSNEQQLNVTTVQALRDENNNLKTQLQQSNNFVSQLQAQLSTEQHNISSQVNTLQQENLKLNASNNDLNQVYSELQTQFVQLQQQKDIELLNLSTEKQTLAEELSKTKVEISELKIVINNTESALQQSREHIHSLQSEISSLNKHMEELVSAKEDAVLRKVDVENLEGKMRNISEENDKLKCQLQQKEMEITMSTTELQTTLNEKEKSSKENLNYLNAELESCRNHIKKLESTIVEQTRQMEESELVVLNKDEYCNKLSNELLASQNYCQMLQNIISDLQNKVQSLQKVEVEQAENYMALTTKVKTTEELNSSLQEEILGLHRIMEEHPVWQESGDEARELRLQLQESEEERMRLTEQIENLVLKVQEERIKLENAEQQEGLQTEIDNLNEEVEKLKQELEYAREEVKNRECVGWEDQESWGDAGLEEQHMQQQMQQQQSTQSSSDQVLFTALQAQLAEAEAAQSRLQEELKSSQVRCGKLIKQVKTLKDQASKSQASTSSDLDKFLEQELQTQLTSLQKEYSELQAEKVALVSKTETLLTANERLIDMKEQQDLELETSRSERAALIQQLNALQQWQPDDEGHNQRVSELEAQLRQAREKCVELEEAYEAKLLHDQVDHSVPTEEIGVVTEPLESQVVVMKSDRGTSPEVTVQPVQGSSPVTSDETEALRAQLEARMRELKAREEEHHSLAAYIAQLRGAVEAKSQELAAYEERPSEAELKAELDSALYLLHQRDVRCDELTLELMALMEERDALQLRLSSALRTNEQQRAVAPPAEPTVANNQQEELHSKLSELRALGHMRDVALRGERETRHSEQQQILLQPSTGRSGSPILDSDHTLMRDTQSTPSVLFNWLWGRSTPRSVQDM